MTEVGDDLRATADRLLDALAAYDRFVDERPDGSPAVSAEARAYLADRDSRVSDAGACPGEKLATIVKERYDDAREAQAAAVRQAREQGRSDWSEIVEETEPVREATYRVHTAGYGADPETGERGYLFPRDLCPARLVSMNAGSSPITYPERVAQYRAVADRFDFSPGVVYHPGSGHDASLSATFPESRVVYVDVDEAAMDDLTRAGYEAVGADAAGHVLPDGADVIVLRNAGLIEEAIVGANLRPGGWVLANDHLDSAEHVAGMECMELVGVVPDDRVGDTPPVEATVPDDTEREGEGKRPSRGAVTVQARSPLDLYVFRARPDSDFAAGAPSEMGRP